MLCGVTIVGLAGFTQGPRVARQIWSIVGVHQVEAHAEEIRAAATESGIDPCLLAAVMYAESRGEISAVSDKDALGLFQLMPSAARDAARRLAIPEPTRDELLSDGRLNTRLGANHLAWLIEADGPDLERVLVGYNAGRTKLQRWTREAGGFEAWRAEHARAQDSGALVYAQQVLDFAERFRERGVIVPVSER